MEDTISCIIEAEKKAESIVASANQKAKQIILDGEKDVEQIKNTAIYSVKISRSAKLKGATKKAEEKYNKKIEEGNEKAQKLYESAYPKIKEVVCDIVEELLK